MKPRRILIGDNSGAQAFDWEKHGRVDCIQKAGKVLEGETVRIVLADDFGRQEMGLTRCVYFAPRNHWDAVAGRGRYIFEKVEPWEAEEGMVRLDAERLEA